MPSLQTTVKSGSMPDLHKHLASRQSMSMGYPAHASHNTAIRQHLADRQYAANTRIPKTCKLHRLAWVGPRSGPYDSPYKRRPPWLVLLKTRRIPTKDTNTKENGL
ncbi:unnamed protein product [Chrysodeixis includens]|uniref:Uncharacterized protein n=1 Tax=Chrysodeixis includens TaxID=689277 RepID=A0A9P0GYP4_CHRIL|nr:unnamed protein product [Chrysodeixis includens]